MSPNVDNVFRVGDEIIGRLFNHKPFIFGEIRFIVREFEEVRGESDLNQLTDTLKRFTEFKDSQTESAIDLCHQLDQRLNTSLDSIDNLTQEVLVLEEQQNSVRKDVLRSKKEDSDREMIGLAQLTKDKITEVERQFEEQENKLRDFYKELETKLKISPN